jgi:hypothetical protein
MKNYVKKRTRTSAIGFPAIDLNDEEIFRRLNNAYFSREIELLSKRSKFVKNLPLINSFRSAYTFGSEVIHGIPGLYTNIDLDNLEIYIGRTTKTTFLGNIFYKAKQNFDGVVVFAKCEMQRAKKYEKLCQAILMKQRLHKGLCVKGILNKRAHSGGPENDTEALIYVAWKISRATGYIGFPTIDTRYEIAHEIMIENNTREISPGLQTLVKALESARRPRTCQHIYWEKI